MLYKPYVIKLRQIDPVLSAEFLQPFIASNPHFPHFFTPLASRLITITNEDEIVPQKVP